MSKTQEMTVEEVALARLPEPSMIENAFGLPAGAVELNGLNLAAADLEYPAWEQMGHFLGAFNRWSRFALGDWLNWGQERFAGDGDIWAQATEATPSERYDVAHRVTGLKVETLRNYASVCGRVPRKLLNGEGVQADHRRVELGFGEHEAVAALELGDQAYWLNRAVEESWNREDLRNAIREAKNPTSEEDDDGGQVVHEEELSTGERAFEVLQLIVGRSQVTSDGGLLVPPEIAAQARAAVGEE